MCTYQHELLVLLLQQAAVKELVLRCHIGKVEALAAQALVRAATEAQSHNGLALRCRKEREREEKKVRVSVRAGVAC